MLPTFVGPFARAISPAELRRTTFRSHAVPPPLTASSVLLPDQIVMLMIILYYHSSTGPMSTTRNLNL
jgi:hypothetical protein